MTFIIFVMVIIALVLSINGNSEIKKLKKENENLKSVITKIFSIIKTNPELAEKLKENIENEILEKEQTQNMQYVQPAYNTNKQTIQKNEYKTAQKENKKKNNSIENLFGKNVIGIVASVLIFIGVITFGTLIFTSFTDVIKVVAMFFVSFATTGVGLFISRKNKTTFSEILTGCGIGTIYISIFMTHLYFGMISDVLTFILIFLWSIGISIISKKFTMKSLSYVALIGCVISSVFSLIYGFVSLKFVEITIYHIITFILLIISNKENKILFKISSYSSIILNTILGGIISSKLVEIKFNEIYEETTSLIHIEKFNYSLLVLCIILAVYNIAIYIYSSRETIVDKIMDTYISNIIHYISITVTFCVPISMLLKDVVLANNDTISSICFLVSTVVIVILSQIIYSLINKDTLKQTHSFFALELFLILFILISPITMQDYGVRLLLPFSIINSLGKSVKISTASGLFRVHLKLSTLLERRFLLLASPRVLVAFT